MRNRVVIFTAILLIPLLAYTQDIGFQYFILSDPVATAKDGINVGGGIEYQMTQMYFNAQVFVFPDLNGKTYFELSATPLGFNIHNRSRTARAYTGIKLGIIKRELYGSYPLVGFQIGGDIFIGKSNFFIGGLWSYDTREDMVIWDQDLDSEWKLNGLIRVGKRFKRL